MSEQTSYKSIFKSTALFGSVQILKTLLGIIKNKTLAILLGPAGIGVIGILQNTIQFIQTGAGLGINQSAVRDISEAYAMNDTEEFSKIASVTRHIIVYVAILGLFTTIILSPWLSKWVMGSSEYTISFAILSIVVALNILTEGNLAILKGMRQLNSLAKASIYGVFTGVVCALPIYFIWGIDGIIPELIVSAVVSMIFVNFYTRKVKYRRKKLSKREIIIEATPIIKMGAALMFVTFLQTIVALIVAAYVRSTGGIEIVGYYNAGNTILNSYFGIIITAIMTDYYPRIAAVNNDNEKIQEELNRQSAVTIVLAAPLVVGFLFFMPLILRILYSSEFSQTNDFLKYGIYGALITLCSNQVDMILVAKFKIKLFTTIAIIIRVIQLFLSVLLFKIFGLTGLGIMVLIMSIIHMIVMTISVNKLYNIRYNDFFIKIASIVVAFAVTASISCEISNSILKYILGTLLMIMSLLFSYIISKKYFQIDFVKVITTLFINKQ